MNLDGEGHKQEVRTILGERFVKFVGFGMLDKML